MDIRPESKKQIESILGQSVSDEALLLIVSDFDIAINTHALAEITQRHPLINVPNRCRRSRVLDLTGHALTLEQGQNTFKLSDFMCGVNGTFSRPVNIIATAQSGKPVFMTVMHDIISGGTDIKLTFFSWHANGTPAPHVPFHWRCRAELA